MTLCAILLGSTMTAQSQTIINCPDTAWTQLVSAIAYVESGCNPKAVSKRGESVGILQITPIAVRECNIILKSQGSKKRYTLSDRISTTASVEMFLLIQGRHNPERNLEKAIRMWNGGPKYKIRSTQNYYEKVMKQYKIVGKRLITLLVNT